MSEPAEQWCLVLPVKRLATAKTRLATYAGERRRALALAFALDTAEAALLCRGVRAVIAVTDEPEAARDLRALGADVVADEPDAGLNPAIRHGGQAASAAHPGCGIGALSADLPALRPAELARALDLGSRHRSAFVRDASGSGTTLLLAREAVDLAPGFGLGSADRHAGGGAVEIVDPAIASLRRDVDTEADLVEAASLGLGARSRRVVDELAAHRLPAGD